MSNRRRTCSGEIVIKRPTNVLQFKRDPEVRRRKPQWRKNWAYGLLLLAPFVGIIGAWFWHVTTAPALAGKSGSAEQYEVSFSRCSGPIRITCVVDGDTIWLEGQKIRVADINAPEVSNPDCPTEGALGSRATSRLTVLLNDGGFSLRAVDHEEDRYGRKLRIITRDGQSLGRILVANGLAESWTGSRRSWC